MVSACFCRRDNIYEKFLVCPLEFGGSFSHVDDAHDGADEHEYGWNDEDNSKTVLAITIIGARLHMHVIQQPEHILQDNKWNNT